MKRTKPSLSGEVLTEFVDDRRASTDGTIRRMVTLAVMLVVVVVVLNAVFDALDSSAPPDDHNLSDAWNATEDLTGTSLEIAPIVLIVLVAIAVLAILRRRFG